MLTKLLTLLASILLLFGPANTNVKPAVAANAGVLASSAVLTACIGPMTLQALPKERGLLLLAFAAGGCSGAAHSSFSVRFGKIASSIGPQKQEIKTHLVERI